MVCTLHCINPALIVESSLKSEKKTQNNKLFCMFKEDYNFKSSVKKRKEKIKGGAQGGSKSNMLKENKMPPPQLTSIIAPNKMIWI